ncbi:MAG: hypothetical protein P8J59_02910 [Phycisphaerales bacterium]|nr:hypothetical protein [Phycisphaerales bacterium]
MLQERLGSIGLPIFSVDLSGDSSLDPIIQSFSEALPTQRHPFIKPDIADVRRHPPSLLSNLDDQMLNRVRRPHFHLAVADPHLDRSLLPKQAETPHHFRDRCCPARPKVDLIAEVLQKLWIAIGIEGR